ncbi:MAG: Hsp20/alpha crystallin family protein [Deltaproteobacteria bacterium]|nr:Hsp20/alpha crystallin family protein [Deltaproteobacteria bacterium]
MAMSVVRYDPFRDLFAFSDQFNRLFGPGRREEGLASTSWPAVDIYEDAEGLTLTAELPGLDPKAVDVKVEDRVLTLAGERKLEREEKKENYHRVESWSGTFSRSFTLPANVDVEKIRAEHKNGLLRVFLPKREENKPRKISVQVHG